MNSIIPIISILFLGVFNCNDNDVQEKNIATIHKEFIFELEKAPLKLPQESTLRKQVYSNFDFCQFKEKKDNSSNEYILYEKGDKEKYLKIKEQERFGSVFFKIYENDDRIFFSGWLESFEEKDELIYLGHNGYFVYDKKIGNTFFIGMNSSFENDLKPKFNTDDIQMILLLDCNLVPLNGFHVQKSRILSRSTFSHENDSTSEFFELMHIDYYNELMLSKISFKDLDIISRKLNPKCFKAKAELKNKNLLWYSFPPRY